MNYNFNEIEEILNEALGECPDGIFASEDWVLDGDKSPFFVDEFLTTEVIANSLNYKFAAGCTRMVIIPKDKDYVIKLPITGLYDSKGIYGTLSTTTLDAFSTEEKIYGSASDDLRKFLLPNVCVGCYGEVPVYIQKKIETTFHAIYPAHLHLILKSQMTPQQISSVDEVEKKSGNILFCELFIKDCISKFGKDSTIEILNEIKNVHIMDIHTNNYGYLPNGVPCLFDYGGYEDSMWD